MHLTIETFPFILRFGEEKAYKLIKETGFDGIDFSYNALGNGSSILEYTSSVGRNLINKYENYKKEV